MVFLDCLKNPIKDQVNTFKLEENELKGIQIMQLRTKQLFNLSDMTKAIERILQRENLWAKQKNMIIKKEDDPERTS